MLETMVVCVYAPIFCVFVQLVGVLDNEEFYDNVFVGVAIVGF